MGTFDRAHAWDQGDLTQLLSLEAGAQDTFHGTVNDSNANGRVYAGQLLLDIRPVNPEAHRAGTAARNALDYWVRLLPPLTAEGCLHHAALAYLCDCWFNGALAPTASAGDFWQQHYVANLNHTLWFHTPEPACDDWLLFVSQATRSLAGRGLALAHIYRRDGRLIASMAQDLLISSRTD